MYTLFARHIAPAVLNFDAGLGSGKSFFVPSLSFSLSLMHPPPRPLPADDRKPQRM